MAGEGRCIGTMAIERKRRFEFVGGIEGDDISLPHWTSWGQLISKAPMYRRNENRKESRHDLLNLHDRVFEKTEVSG